MKVLLYFHDCRERLHIKREVCSRFLPGKKTFFPPAAKRRENAELQPGLFSNAESKLMQASN